MPYAIARNARLTATVTVLLAGLIGLTNVPRAEAWELNPQASRLALIGTADRREAVTRVEDLEIDIDGDLDEPTEGHLVLTLKSRSISAGNDIVDSMLHGRHWFEVDRYPEIVFRSRDIQAPAEGEWRIVGELGLRGERYPLTVPVAWTREDDRLRVSGRLTLDRTDYDMGRGVWRSEGTVKHAVQVEFDLELLAPAGS